MKNLIGTNGRPTATLIGQQHHLVGKWPMADRYIVLCTVCNTTWSQLKIQILKLPTQNMLHMLYVTVSALFAQLNFFYYIFTHYYLQCPRNGSPKFQPSENKLQVLAFAAITSVWISLQS